MIRLTVLSGLAQGRTIDVPGPTVRVGRAEDSDLVLDDDIVSGDHAVILSSDDGYRLRDLRSTNGTWVVRGASRLSVDEPGVFLEPGDVIELGASPSIRVSIQLPDETAGERVLALRPMADLADAIRVEYDTGSVRRLYEVQKRVGAAAELTEILSAIAEGALELVDRATHVTVVLREDDDPAAATSRTSYVPVLTRIRGQQATGAPIPISRTVFRKVVSERAAVLAADAPHEVGSTESLVGAQIRSVLGVPLFRGDEILGVLQLDNREKAGVFSQHDMEMVAALASNASLAVANGRMLRRLRAAEERLKKENAYLKGREASRRGAEQQKIIGQSAAMRTLFEQLGKVVDTRVTVLVEGETGVGKELIASAVHYRSRRRDKMFVSQNCAALPEQLLESELFGHKRGSFTGAHEDKKGLFEIADGGTLFLDEVTEMPLSLQSKLLRALQEGEIRPIGATHEKRVDVRIVAATNRTLEKEVSEGRFREDLYYRLKVFPLRVPPLRERRDDIPLIAEFFLERYTSELGKATAGFSQQAMELLQAYDFPGNVRELQNEIQRIMIQVDAGDFIVPEHLSPRLRKVEGVLDKVKPTKGTLKEMMDQVERWILIESLREHDNNKTAAARTLGLTREGLHKKLRTLGLS